MSSNPRPKVRIKKLKRATADTKFYIDYGWWDESNLDLKTYLSTRLSINDTSAFDSDIDQVDIVDSRTAEVHQVDGFQYVIQTFFHQMADDFVTQASLVDGAFYVLLANANQPLTAMEIGERIQRSADVVVRTLGGPKIYQGIRPLLTDN